MDLKLQLEIRFLLGLLFMMIFSFCKPKSRRLNILAASFILFVIFGIKHLIFLSITILINFILIKTKLKTFNEYIFIIINIINIYIYKIFGKVFISEIQGTYDISGFLMVFVIKMSYLSRDIREIDQNVNEKQDDLIKEESEKNKSYSKNIPSSESIPVSNEIDSIRRRQIGSSEIKNQDDNKKKKERLYDNWDILHFLLFIPGLVSGPTPTFKDFFKRDKTVTNKIEYSKIAKVICYMLIHGILRKFGLEQKLLYSKDGFLKRLFNLFLFNFGGRMKFHFIWGFADICFILFNFYELHNIDFYKVEFTESVREISSNWNKFINKWIKELFFLKLKENSIRKAVLVAHLASALLHGLNVCYLVFFLSFAMFSKPISNINLIIPFKWLRQVQMLFFVSYFSLPFYMLDLRKTLIIWKNLYFFGHVYCFSLMAIFFFYKPKK